MLPERFSGLKKKLILQKRYFICKEKYGAVKVAN